METECHARHYPGVETECPGIETEHCGMEVEHRRMETEQHGMYISPWNGIRILWD